MGRFGLTAPDLRVRHRQAELMDAPDLDRRRHVDALTALGRINRVSLTARRVWAEVRLLERARGSPGERADGHESRGEPVGRGGEPARARPLRLLDVACGGGDVLRSVAALARRHRVPVELHGCDVSPVALEEARRRAPALRFFRLDVRADSFPGGYDLLCSSLFLHHLADQEAVQLLRRMKEATAGSLLVEDLRRSRLGYGLAWLGLRTLTRSDVARTDGLRSVRAAFRLDEARALCARAGLDGVGVRPCWPQRFTIRWAVP